MKCPNCNEEVAEHVRHCVVCGADVGCPNVRAAQRTEEVDALELRAKEAKDNSIKRGCKKVFHDFRDAVKPREQAQVILFLIQYILGS